MKDIKNIKVLILGATGMLGSMVYSYLKNQTVLKVQGTARNKDSDLLEFDAADFALTNNYTVDFDQYDYILNCIGVIKPYCKDDDSQGCLNAVTVNSLFPRVLSEKVTPSTKIIQIATDCVYSGAKGAYVESDPHDALDVYGKSKSLGEVTTENFLNIRSSIIGPEEKNYVSLLEWFLHQKPDAELKGFTHHSWNGVTTLQFAKLMELIIEKNYFSELQKVAKTHHFTPNSLVNKFELLNIFKNVFQKECSIEATDSIGSPVKRDISSSFNMLSEIYPSITMGSALQELKEYMTSKY
jgi:dTDP-4-dehydrorhamnose reductase